MIAGFRHKGLRRFFEDDDRSRLPQDMVERIGRLLAALDAAQAIDDIAAVQSFRLHQLQGDLKGHWAITVRANWRITFRASGDRFDDLDFVDYH